MSPRRLLSTLSLAGTGELRRYIRRCPRVSMAQMKQRHRPAHQLAHRAPIPRTRTPLAPSITSQSNPFQRTRWQHGASSEVCPSARASLTLTEEKSRASFSFGHTALLTNTPVTMPPRTHHTGARVMGARVTGARVGASADWWAVDFVWIGVLWVCVASLLRCGSVSGETDRTSLDACEEATTFSLRVSEI